MTEILLIVGILLLVTVILMVAVLLRRVTGNDLSPMLARMDTLEKFQERTERSVKEEIGRNRQETAEQARGLREEVQGSLKNSTDSLVQSIERISAAQRQRLEDFADQLNAVKQASDLGSAQLRVELTNALNLLKESQEKRLSDNATQLQQHFESFAAQLANLTGNSERKSDELRATVEARLAQLQTENSNKLEEMRRTVDEKLQGTLDKRLGESFKLVSDRLEQVHKGLGEMQTLATGVGDLKRVLTNVKTRGTWGEVQLGNLLEQILTADQFARNVRTQPTGQEAVEFAIKLPGRDEDGGKVVWLPIDAKFPKEDYERLVDAAERGDAEAVEQAAKNLDSRVRSQARDIRDKYLSPPHTTDFGLMYLPTEGLYAEVLRRPGLVDSLQREQRVVVVGPTTLAALLNSLQMGFRTLAIEKRSSEVWNVLGAVKTEFGKFGDMLDKVKKKLDETGNTIEEAAHRSRQLEKRLKRVEALPVAEAAAVLTEAQSADLEAELPGESGESQ
jgi:DNA recombination protein RmuC